MRTRLTAIALPTVALALAGAAFVPAFADPGNGKSGDHAKNDKSNSAQAPGKSNAKNDKSDPNASGGNSSQAQQQDPPGNNGTFKVDGVPFDDGKGNEPHVACGFRLKFYGFDKDQYGDITIEGHAPSGSGVVSKKTHVLISDDAAGGGNDEDAVIPYTDADLNLSGLTAHPKQGYHLKVTLTTDTPGGVKHKVFWYEPCAAPTPSVSPTVIVSESPSPVVSESPSPTPVVIVSETPTPQVSATETQVAPTPTPQVKGVKLTHKPTVLGSVLRRAGLPFTGSPITTLLAIGGLLLAVGVGATVIAKKRHA